jgi:hypothetical protein
MVVIRRVTAVSGIVAGAAGAAQVGLYFVYPGPPPEWNVVTRNLIGIVLALALLLFVAGLCRVVRGADEVGDWLSGLALAAGAGYVVVTLVAASLETGVVFAAGDRAVDPTVDGPLAMGNVLLHGSVGRALTALFLVVVGVAILRTRALPAWTGWTAVVVAGVNALFVPALYFGTDPARFYSAIGWGNTALTGSLVVYWACAVGVTMAVHKRVKAHA